MPYINWDHLVNEGRAISRGVPLPEGITHISQMKSTIDDTDTVTVEYTKREIMDKLTEKGIEFKVTMNKETLLALLSSELSVDEDTIPDALNSTENTEDTNKAESKVSDGNDEDTI